MESMNASVEDERRSVARALRAMRADGMMKWMTSQLGSLALTPWYLIPCSRFSLLVKLSTVTVVQLYYHTGHTNHLSPVTTIWENRYISINGPGTGLRGSKGRASTSPSIACMRCLPIESSRPTPTAQHSWEVTHRVHSTTMVRSSPAHLKGARLVSM